VRFADKVTWASGYDSRGDPIWTQPVPPVGPTVEVWPSMLGAVSHNPSAYNPKTGLVYIASREIGMLWAYVNTQVDRGVLSTGVAYENLDGGSEVERAFDVRSGKPVWRRDVGKAGYAGGMLTTAGQLTFWADQGGSLFAADAQTGEILWTLPVHVTAKSAPMTYRVGGRQQVTFALGGYGGVGSVVRDWNNVNYTALLITLGL
jgi:glucose dehydrogenase